MNISPEKIEPALFIFFKYFCGFDVNISKCSGAILFAIFEISLEFLAKTATPNFFKLFIAVPFFGKNLI